MAKDAGNKGERFSRRVFLSRAAVMPFLMTERDARAARSVDTRPLRIVSPNGAVRFEVFLREECLSYRVSLNNMNVIETSKMGIVVDDGCAPLQELRCKRVVVAEHDHIRTVRGG